MMNQLPVSAQRKRALARRRTRRGPWSGRTHFDVVFYLPSISPLLSSDPSPPPGGAETQVLLVSRELARLGYRVGLVAYDDPGLPAETADGISVIGRPRRPSGSGFIDRVREVHRVWGTLSHIHTPVIVKRVHGHEVAVIALHSRVHGRRFVYSSANVIDVGVRSGLDRPSEVALHNFGVMIANGIVVQTEEQRSLCKQHLHRDAQLVNSIAEPAVCPKGIAPDAFLWVGRIVPYKRPLAYIRLARSLPQYKFRMIAVPGAAEPDALSRETHEMARQTRNLQLLPTRTRAKLGELLAGSIAIVNTSDYEGMPNVFLEAWSLGVPALTLSCDPDAVIMTHRLGLSAGGSEAMLADAASKLAVPSSRANFAGQCRQYVNVHHSAPADTRRWVDVLGLDHRSGPTAG